VIVAIAIGAGCTMPAQLEAADQEHSDIRLLIVNEAGVDSSILTVAKAEATRIYDAFGIRLVCALAAFARRVGANGSLWEPFATTALPALAPRALLTR